jgi:hypothetical protein
METIACVTQLKEHVCIFNVVTDLVLDYSGTVDEPWIMRQWSLEVIYLSDKPIRADRRCNVARDLCITSNVIKPGGKVKGA